MLDAGLRRINALQTGISSPEATLDTGQREALADTMRSLVVLAMQSRRPRGDAVENLLQKLHETALELVNGTGPEGLPRTRETLRELEWQTRSHAHLLRHADPATLGFVLEEDAWRHCGAPARFGREEKVVRFRACVVTVMQCAICGVRHETVIEDLGPGNRKEPAVVRPQAQQRESARA